jgi:hypothetical protein
VNTFDFDQLCDALEEFETMKSRADLAIQNIKDSLLNQLRAQQSTSTTTAKGRKITLVEPVKSSWDEDVLKDILGPLWSEVVIVKEVLSEEKLDQVVTRERIRTETLQDAVIEKEIKPYVKITKPRGRSE